MGQLRKVDPRRGNYIPWLEGVRGYGFLLVFYGHYFVPFQLASVGTAKYGFLISISSLALFAVPAFFVLSGYLIGGLLYDTRNQEGFFRVFYSRRILRVFPVYYLTLLAIAFFYQLHGFALNYRFWIHFLYIQNLFPGYKASAEGPALMIHFWSLAVEEQFYLLWPIVVWFFPQRTKLIRIATGVVVCCCLLRIFAPLFIATPSQFSASTPARIDAILLGVILALTRESNFYRRFQRVAKWILLGGAVTTIVLANWKGWNWWDRTTWGQEVAIPLTHIVGVALIVAVLEPNSLLQRACSFRWVCWLGGLSYSGYIFHLVFARYFMLVLPSQLSAYVRPHFAMIFSCSLAFCLTILLSVVSKICIESPAMNLKRRLRYGPERRAEMRAEVEERELVGTSA